MGTAYWQQKQTMAKNTQDPNQKQPGQAIMKIFPVFFGFISFNMPAGLVTYFAASQIFRIGQQALILRMDENRQSAAAVKPASGEIPEKQKKQQSSPPRAAGSSGSRVSGTGQATPKQRPQGSKKRRGKKRRRR
jgi:membrane protein insertase Oxa1/YidC/SpoIIIJ